MGRDRYTEVSVVLSAHARKRMDQYGLRDTGRLRAVVRRADPAYFDRRHGSKLVVLTAAGHAAAVADEAGVRTVITVLPPPEIPWDARVAASDRYERLE